jgi:hypothetical protein
MPRPTGVLLLPRLLVRTGDLSLGLSRRSTAPAIRKVTNHNLMQQSRPDAIAKNRLVKTDRARYFTLFVVYF